MPKRTGYKLPDKVNVEWGNWGEPLFPKWIEELQRAYDALTPGQASRRLSKAVRGLRNFPLVQVITEPWTVEQFVWKAGYEFQLSDSTPVVVLFSKKPRNRSTRHCAVYTREEGRSQLPELERFVEELAEAIEKK